MGIAMLEDARDYDCPPRFTMFLLGALNTWHSVRVSREHNQKEVENWIVGCLKSGWSIDWSHGNERSASEEDKRTVMYLFESLEDAALARTGWG